MEFDAVFVAGGGGTTVSSGRVHLDRLSAFEESQFVPLTAFPEVTNVDGLTVDFLANWSNGSSPYPPGVSWDFGDGMVGSGETTSHTYLAPGTYTVTMTLDNGFRVVMGSLVVTLPSGATDTPTISPVGLVLLVGLLMVLAVAVLRRRSAA